MSVQWPQHDLNLTYLLDDSTYNFLNLLHPSGRLLQLLLDDSTYVATVAVDCIAS